MQMHYSTDLNCRMAKGNFHRTSPTFTAQNICSLNEQIVNILFSPLCLLRGFIAYLLCTVQTPLTAELHFLFSKSLFLGSLYVLVSQTLSDLCHMPKKRRDIICYKKFCLSDIWQSKSWKLYFSSCSPVCCYTHSNLWQWKLYEFYRE